MASNKRRGLTFYRKEKKKNKTGLVIIQYVSGIVLSVLLAFVLYFCFGMSTWEVGDSMNPIISEGEEVLIDRFTVSFVKPKTGDVIAFYPNGNEKSHLSIKRVIATPGDKIYISEGNIYINGEKFDDIYGVEPMLDPGLAKQEIKLEDDEFFVLGDNRNFSEDSRSGNLGPVKLDHIYGKIWFKLGTENSEKGFVKS